MKESGIQVVHPHKIMLHTVHLPKFGDAVIDEQFFRRIEPIKFPRTFPASPAVPNILIRQIVMCNGTSMGKTETLFNDILRTLPGGDI